MEKYKNFAIKRTQDVIFYDRLASPANFKKAIKLEIFSALSQFMNITEDDIKLSITVLENGTYSFNFSASTNQIKPIGIVMK